jgi:hypothetical protein
MGNNKRLYLDDRWMPHETSGYANIRGWDPDIYQLEWIIVRSYKEFTDWITENGLPEIISFDNDLGDNPALKEAVEFGDWFDIEKNREYEGHDCAKWLCEYCMDNLLTLPKWVIHSANQRGYENIRGVLMSFEKSQNEGDSHIAYSC